MFDEEWFLMSDDLIKMTKWRPLYMTYYIRLDDVIRTSHRPVDSEPKN